MKPYVEDFIIGKMKEYNKKISQGSFGNYKIVKKEYNEDGTNLFIKNFVPFFVNAERFLSKHGGI